MKKDFDMSLKYFGMAFTCLYRAMVTLVGYLVVNLLLILDGKIRGRYIIRPYLYVWRFVMWALFIWVLFTFVCVPFFRWWDKVISFFDYLIWG